MQRSPMMLPDETTMNAPIHNSTAHATTKIN
jgi:hypothetical protein